MKMVNITFDGENEASVSEKAFQEIWAPSGWRLVDEPVSTPEPAIEEEPPAKPATKKTSKKK